MHTQTLFTRAALAALPALSFGAVASAQDAIVPDDFATIQSAVSSASDVDLDGTVEILVRAGTYVENVLIRRSNLSLSGEGAATTSVVGAGFRETIRVEDADSVSISGFRVSNSILEDGIELQRTTGSSVLDTVLTGNRDGLSVQNSQGALVMNNEAFGNAGEGIRFRGAAFSTCLGNSSHDNQHHGIDVRRSFGIALDGNTTNGNTDSGLRVRQGVQVTVASHVSNGNSDSGILVRRAADCSIVGSTCSGNLDNGLRLRDTANNLFSQNSFTGNNEFGIRMENANDDFDAGPSGNQAPPGDNDLSGNGNGAVRVD
jgi:parallel beta-helix repeat protein